MNADSPPIGEAPTVFRPGIVINRPITDFDGVS
jgi:hypothetical protein